MTTQQAAGLELINKLPVKQKNAFLDAFVNTILLNHSWPFTMNEKQCSISDKDGNVILYASTSEETVEIFSLITRYHNVTTDLAIVEEEESNESVEVAA